MTQTLEQLLKDLCEKHDLWALAIGFSRKSDAIGPDYGWNCVAHFGAAQCESASARNPQDAIIRTLQTVHEKRVCQPEVPAIIALELAA